MGLGFSFSYKSIVNDRKPIVLSADPLDPDLNNTLFVSFAVLAFALIVTYAITITWLAHCVPSAASRIDQQVDLGSHPEVAI